MPRYEHADSVSFWEIEKSADGESFTARWGKLGSEGRKKTKTYDDAYACSAAYDELVEEKLKLGYKLQEPRLAFAGKSNPQLEATLCEALEDPARWAVYADWLQEVGDPRGQVIALVQAGQPDEAKAFADANADVLWGNAWYLRGDDPFEGITWMPGWKDATRQPIAVSFAYTLDTYGFIESITMEGLDEEGHVAKAMYAILAAPLGRFTRSIDLMVTHDPYDGRTSMATSAYSGASGMPNYGAVVEAIARAQPTALRRLAIASGDYQLSWTRTGELAPLLAATPHLTTLRIEMGDINLGDTLNLPRLESLRLETGGLGRENLLAIGDASWPSLHELVLYFGIPDYGGDATAADVEALLATPAHFPTLSTLALCNSEVPGDIVRAITKSPLLAQLTTLDLSKGTMTDEDARPLLENLGALAHLEKLDLSENYLSPATVAALETLACARCYNQRHDEMVQERERHAHEEWAKNAKFRYTRVSE